jgi:hypothetical protein
LTFALGLSDAAPTNAGSTWSSLSLPSSLAIASNKGGVPIDGYGTNTQPIRCFVSNTLRDELAVTGQSLMAASG